MIEKLFSIGSFPVSPFGVFLLGAFLASFFQLRANLLRLGIGDDEDAHALLFWAAIGGVAGGKIYYAILHGDPSLLLERFGIVWYGGFLLATLAVTLAIRRRRMPFRSSADAIAPAMAIGYSVGRIGCFLVGDDYGVPTQVPWGVAFPVGLPPTEARYLREAFGLELPGVAGDVLLKVHPTQVYETVLALGIWYLGQRLLKSGLRPGGTALAVFAMLAVERFAVEFLRAKDDRLLGGMTVAQGLSLGILIVLGLLWTRWRNTLPQNAAS